MHHARHRQIHAVGAAIVERVRDAMRKFTPLISPGSGVPGIVLSRDFDNVPMRRH
jgi:hypothetical protein